MAVQQLFRAAALAVLMAGCAPGAGRAPRGLSAPPPVSAAPGPAARAVAPATRPPLALGLTRKIADWTAAIEPLGTLPGATAATPGLRIDLADAPLGAYLSTGAQGGAGLRWQSGTRGAALGTVLGPTGPDLALGLEDRYSTALLPGARVVSRLRAQGDSARADVGLEQGLGAFDYRVVLRAADVTGAGDVPAAGVDVLGRAVLPGGGELSGSWQSATAPGAADRARLDFSLDAHDVSLPFADAMGAHCERAARIGCGLDVSFTHGGWRTRVSPQWRTSTDPEDRAALESTLVIELIGALQRLELAVPTSGEGLPGLGYRVELPLR